MNDPRNDELEELDLALSKSLVQDGIELISDLGETLLDDRSPFTGVLKDIPIISVMASMARIGLTFRDRHFTRKVLRFLHAYWEIPKKEREDFEKKLQGNEKYRKRVGEVVLVTMDRIDSELKADFVARIFKAVTDGKISVNVYRRICMAIERIQLKDLWWLKYIAPPYMPQHRDIIAYQSLFSAGLLLEDTEKGALRKPFKKKYQSFQGMKVEMAWSPGYLRSQLGEILLQVIQNYAPNYLKKSKPSKRRKKQ